jgi:hypothetical protein
MTEVTRLDNEPSIRSLPDKAAFAMIPVVQRLMREEPLDDIEEAIPPGHHWLREGTVILFERGLLVRTADGIDAHSIVYQFATWGQKTGKDG